MSKSKEINELGYASLCSFVSSKLDEGEEPSSCWNSAMYFFSIYGIKGDIDNINETYTENILSSKPLEDEIIKMSNGIFHWYIENDSEFHHFVTEIIDDKLTLIQTYGGIDKLVVKKYNKNEWYENFISALKDGNTKSYSFIFNLPMKIAKKIKPKASVIRYVKQNI